MTGSSTLTRIRKMKRTTTLASLAAMSFTVLSMAAAQAQMPDPHHPAPGAPAQMGMPMPGAEGSAPPMAAGMARMMEMMQPMMAARGGMGMPFEHVEGRIAYLKAELHVTDAQMPAWNAFAETMRTDAAGMKAMQEEMMKGGIPTTMPDRMALRHNMMSSRLAAMDHSEASMKALYAALSPDQRKAFDQMMSGPMGMM
jgi:hypothetical protein